MRVSFSLLIIVLWLILPVARARAGDGASAGTQQAAVGPAQAAPAGNHPASRHSIAPQSLVATPLGPQAVESSRAPSSRHSPRSRPAAGAARGAAAERTGGVLALGATDITGNKELPKVMVIVPWKDSLGAGGVLKPTDSLLDEALEPVDRDVFQRRVHYYGQLKDRRKPSAVGDR